MKKTIAIVLVILALCIVAAGYYFEKSDTDVQTPKKDAQTQTWLQLSGNSIWWGNVLSGDSIQSGETIDGDVVSGSDTKTENNANSGANWNEWNTNTTAGDDAYSDDAMKDPDVQEVLKLFEELTK